MLSAILTNTYNTLTCVHDEHRMSTEDGRRDARGAPEADEFLDVDGGL